MTCRSTILIAGGGASGALTAANLLRNAPDVRVVIVDPHVGLGRGMAYSTTCPLHLLNVPAGNMSTFPDDPPNFLRWLHARGLTQYDAGSFVPRMVYGEYLSAVLDSARATAGRRRFEHVRAQAVGFSAEGDRVHLRLANAAGSLSGDGLVLALGNAAPSTWPNLPREVAESGRFFGIAWTPDALRPAAAGESILLIGTGLTAIDAVLELRHNGHRGPILMISRRGLLPQAHRLNCCHPISFPNASSARDLLRNMRVTARDAEIVHHNWRAAVDGVRPQTNHLWQMLSLCEQSRFLRHLRPYWDVHRHRMAPEIASSIHALIAKETLHVLAGRMLSIRLSGQSLDVTVRHRASGSPETLAVSRIVNCTGPECNLSRHPNPLVRDLIRQGLLLPHPLRTGALVNNQGALVGRDGEPSRVLFALGPLRLGNLIETVAMPEIRQQAVDLARLLIDPTLGERMAASDYRAPTLSIAS